MDFLSEFWPFVYCKTIVFLKLHLNIVPGDPLVLVHLSMVPGHMSENI